MSFKFENLTFNELEARLRKAGGTWFRNDDLLLLEELIRRAANSRQRLLHIGKAGVGFDKEGKPIDDKR